MTCTFPKKINKKIKIKQTRKRKKEQMKRRNFVIFCGMYVAHFPYCLVLVGKKRLPFSSWRSWWDRRQSDWGFLPRWRRDLSGTYPGTEYKGDRSCEWKNVKHVWFSFQIDIFSAKRKQKPWGTSSNSTDFPGYLYWWQYYLRYCSFFFLNVVTVDFIHTCTCAGRLSCFWTCRQMTQGSVAFLSSAWSAKPHKNAYSSELHSMAQSASAGTGAYAKKFSALETNKNRGFLPVWRVSPKFSWAGKLNCWRRLRRSAELRCNYAYSDKCPRWRPISQCKRRGLACFVCPPLQTPQDGSPAWAQIVNHMQKKVWSRSLEKEKWNQGAVPRRRGTLMAGVWQGGGGLVLWTTTAATTMAMWQIGRSTHYSARPKKCMKMKETETSCTTPLLSRYQQNNKSNQPTSLNLLLTSSTWGALSDLSGFIQAWHSNSLQKVHSISSISWHQFMFPSVTNLRKNK